MSSSSEYSSGISYYGIEDQLKLSQSEPLLSFSALCCLHPLCERSICGRRVLPCRDTLASLLRGKSQKEAILSAFDGCDEGEVEFARRTGLLTKSQADAAVKDGTRYGFTHFDTILARHLADKAAAPMVELEKRRSDFPKFTKQCEIDAGLREPPVEYSARNYERSLQAAAAVQGDVRQTSAPSVEFQALAREALGPDSSPERQLAVAILLEEHAIARLAPYAKKQTREVLDELPDVQELLTEGPEARLRRAADANYIFDRRAKYLVNSNQGRAHLNPGSGGNEEDSDSAE